MGRMKRCCFSSKAATSAGLRGTSDRQQLRLLLALLPGPVRVLLLALLERGSTLAGRARLNIRGLNIGVEGKLTRIQAAIGAWAHRPVRERSTPKEIVRARDGVRGSNAVQLVRDINPDRLASLDGQVGREGLKRRTCRCLASTRARSRIGITAVGCQDA